MLHCHSRRTSRQSFSALITRPATGTHRDFGYVAPFPKVGNSNATGVKIEAKLCIFSLTVYNLRRDERNV